MTMTDYFDTPARNLRDGSWYWASKVVIQSIAKDIGYLPLAVYHFLASMVDTHQICYPSQMFIAKNLGCSRTSVTGAIKKLERCGLIRVIREDKLRNKYKLLSVPGSPGRHVMSTSEPIKVNPEDTNNIRLTKIDTNERTVFIQDTPSPNEFDPSSQKEALAHDLAEALNESNELPLYIAFANTYPESFLRETLSTVNQTPRHKIKKSRGALFTYLVKRYGHQIS